LLDDRLTRQDAFFIMGVTFMLNQLPFRAGEVARSLLATRRGVAFMTAATSIIIERLLDTFLVVLLIVISLTQLPDAPASVVRGAQLFGGAAVVVVLILLFFAYRPQIARSLVERVEQILPDVMTERVALAEWLEQTLLGLQPLTRPRQLGHAVLWTLISWTLSLLSLYALQPGLPIDPDVNLWLNATLGVALASLSIAIPVSVAAIGPFEAAIAVAGELTGINSVLYTALGFLIHGITVLGYVIIGVMGMLRLGVSFSEMLRPSDRPSAEQPEGVQ
jgi:uncharacterized protein (TIRG00374 family)